MKDIVVLINCALIAIGFSMLIIGLLGGHLTIIRIGFPLLALSILNLLALLEEEKK
jgi:hypothetical protein